ncbi:hypothetical protein [Micromonospora endolithica]|uniref:Uncharacterized protein n=1 Tax=Micromonospora endolithica TaxID=230091 RepID=A0A3A9YN77_9ACTN|nr:hypothetical protein [Micromonospora endolithica]RKN37721.1 hypothetical protein D7223_32165 [Micromonospora endolithica]TWJ25320.1 hypothetical protein JD76_05487 [Micromonospora endolithica]
MAMTGAATTGARGQTEGWLGRDPLRTVALAMITIGVLWRAQLAARGFLAADDFVLITQASEADLTPGHLLSLYNNHLMPGGRLLIWLVTEYVGLAYWPYVLLMAIGQAVLGLAFFRLLRRMLRPGWLLLLPLGVLLFSPLTLEATSWWAVGVNMLPMQIAMVLAVGAQVAYVQTRRPRHLVGLALAVFLGLFFFEKALLVVPLVFLLTALLYAEGGVFRTLWTTVRRWWQSWLVLTVLTLGFLAAYLTRSESSLRRPESPGEVLSFLQQMLGSNLLPGLVGGPWRWLGAGDGAPVAAPPELGSWLAWVLVVAVILATVRRDRRAGRAWVLLGAYLVMVATILAATRLGSVFSAVAGGVPRYVSDVVVVAAICLGVALCGLARGPADGVPAQAVPEDSEPEGAAPGPADDPHAAEARPEPVAAAVPAARPKPLVVARAGVIHAEAADDPEPEPRPAPEQESAPASAAPQAAAPPAAAPPAAGPDGPGSGDVPAPADDTPPPTREPGASRTPPGAAEPPTADLLAPIPARYRDSVTVMLVLVLVAVCLGTAWTTSRYSDEWARKSARAYVDTVKLEMASAPPGTVFFDATVPDNVVPSLSNPYNLQSRFFRSFGTRPVFVDEAEKPSVLDHLGRIQEATVLGSVIQPGPEESCGYRVTAGQTVRMPLDKPRDQWHYVVRVGYLSSGAGSAVLRLGDATATFPVKPGLNQHFFRIVGGGDAVELTVTGDRVSFCTNEIAIGDPAPKPE